MKGLILMVLTLMPISIMAQEGHCPKLPAVYSWNTELEYQKDRDVVKKTLRWLCQTPLGVDVRQRSIANEYVMEWLAGTPNFVINIETKHLPFYPQYPDLLFPFIHGMALYQLDHEQEKDKITIYCKGFETLTSLVMQSRELSDKKELKPMLRAAKKKKLREYTRELLSV